MNLTNLFKSKKYHIGFVINGFPLPYNKIMASTRIRVYDVIKNFYADKDYLLELCNPIRKYNVVIFQKKFDNLAFRLAQKIKSKATQIVLDINVNYYDPSSHYITERQYRDIIEFTKIIDIIITPTEFLKNYISNLFPEKEMILIEESIDEMYFKRKKEQFNSQMNLIWVGYSPKANEILVIENILEELYEKIKFNIILISERNPELKIGKIPVFFEKYNHFRIVEQLLKGDIFIAPRNLQNSYNLSHTFTKIGTPMAVGLPVIASPVPSYKNSPAIICKDEKEWKENLAKILMDQDFLQHLSRQGRSFVKDNYSIQIIKGKYRNLFDNLSRA